METKLEQAKKTGLLHLSLKRMTFIPVDVFNVKKLARLDLGFNNITTIPEAIGQLTFLESLWLNNNPLEEISSDIYKCKFLKELDIKDTRLKTLPYELGRVQHLTTLDTRNTPLKSDIRDAPEGIVSYLRKIDTRNTLKTKLFQTLREGTYREVASLPDGDAQLHQVVEIVFREFEVNDEIKSLIRNAERLFPDKIHNIQVEKIRQSFTTLRRDNEMKKLGAELELKIRNIYFDRIDPQIVESMVKSIYTHIRDLQDIKFLLKYAVTLFPDEAKQVDGAILYDDLLALQKQLAEERAAAVNALTSAVKGLYSDAEPDKIQALVTATAQLFKKSKDLKSLASDASIHFPADILNAVPSKVKASFIKTRREMMGDG